MEGLTCEGLHTWNIYETENIFTTGLWAYKIDHTKDWYTPQNILPGILSLQTLSI